MSEHQSDGFDDEPHSGGGLPLAEEAVRLIGAVQDWARTTFPESPEAHRSSDCQWCPICQFMAVLRGERPEITDRVAEAGTAVASAFRLIFDAASASASASAGGSQHRHSGPASGPTGAPRVQRINLGDDPE